MANWLLARNLSLLAGFGGIFVLAQWSYQGGCLPWRWRAVIFASLAMFGIAVYATAHLD